MAWTKDVGTMFLAMIGSAGSLSMYAFLSTARAWELVGMIGTGFLTSLGRAGNTRTRCVVDERRYN